MRISLEDLKNIITSSNTISQEIIHIEDEESWYRLIFEKDGNFYSVDYCICFNLGIIDDDDDDGFECIQVKPIQKTITEWIPV